MPRPHLLVFCTVYALLLLHYPVLQIFNVEGFWQGLPAMYWYVALAWGGIVLLWIVLVERKSPPKNP
ncbi:hypothetical protein [Eisenibacter elegans]|uniref:hypothetical protein n=1 Tax=Eisenibacter elegans TaxID=997 RepID=UPI00047CB3E4|nr:hypothetical protein [Eisenibacter elegans]